MLSPGIKVLDYLDLNEVIKDLDEKNVLIPNEIHPSDHLPLVAKVKFADKHNMSN